MYNTLQRLVKLGKEQVLLDYIESLHKFRNMCEWLSDLIWVGKDESLERTPNG